MPNSLINARLVYDGGDTVHIPPEMGTPREDQMQGTPAERLCELAGRVCYDSLGKGRPSFTQEAVIGVDHHTGEQLLETVEGYHDHIRKVGHGSVWEHFNFTVSIPFDQSASGSNHDARSRRRAAIACNFLNRPGVFVIPGESRTLRVTVNLRAVNEWGNWSREILNHDGSKFTLTDQIGHMLIDHANLLAPHICEIPIDRYLHAWTNELAEASLVEPISDHECWVSMFVSGSRGLSHELVRHGDFTAISQRSTRYVDESESPWIEHPLATAYVDSRSDKFTNPALQDSPDVIGCAQVQYQSCVAVLEPWLISRGVDRATARKQARGAARGYLGNALYTELIFSASVAQWKRILRQRASVHADAEIRELTCKCLAELKRSRYGERFAGWELQPSPDGIGEVAVEST